MPISLAEIINKYKLPKESNSPSKEVALRRAAFQGHQQDIEILLEHNASIGEQAPRTGKTALHWAIVNNHYQVVKVLLDHNANCNLEDANGDTALCFAAKSTDIRLRALIFTKVANDAFRKIENRYSFLSKDEKENNARAKEIFEKIKNDGYKEEEILSSLLVLSRFCLDPDRKNPDEEKRKLIQLSNLFLQVSLSKKIRCQYDELYNYCQLLCQDLAFELLRFKAFRQGKISLYMTAYNWKNGDQHMILWINRPQNALAEDTVLCNPMRKEIFTGVNYVNEYLSKYIFCGEIPANSDAAANIYSKFENFIHEKDGCKQLVKALETAYLEEASNESRYIGATCKMMQEFFCEKYKSLQLNSNNKFRIEKLLGKYEITGAAAKMILSITSSINDKQTAPSNVAPDSSFYQTTTNQTSPPNLIQSMEKNQQEIFSEEGKTVSSSSFDGK